MDSDDPALQPVIVLRVVIRSPDLDTFVAKYSRFVKDDRIFIFTKSSQPPGTRVRFTLELSDGQPLIHGEGTVTRVRPDSGDPTKPPGMELKFVPLDDASRELVARMLRARDGTGQFREESTGARTTVRDPAVPTAPIPLEESKPVLPPLQKTGKLSSIDDLPVQRQDESGAVTLAQAPPGARAATDLEVPNTSPSVPVPLPPPPPTDATAETLLPPPSPSDDKQSGGFSTPTPLPAPIPPAEEFGGTPPPTRLARPSPAVGGPEAGEAADAPFHAVGPAPPFAEAFRDKMPGGNAPAPGATVPANPFSEISDGAIEYFVEWSMEQSTAPKPKVAQASFANVPMATPRAVKRRTSRVPLLAGIGIGLLVGLPVGGAAMWYLGPTPAPVIVEHMPVTAHEARATAARAVAPEPAVAGPSVTPTAAADPATPSTAVATPRAPLAKPTTKPAADKPAAQNLARENLAHETSAGEKSARGASASEAATAGKATADQLAAGKPATDKAAAGQATASKAAGDKPAADKVAAANPTDKPATEKPADAAEATDKPARKGQLQVVTRPPGATVAIDGEARGKTPIVLTLPAGTHDITVFHERYATVNQPVDVPGKLDVTLKRPPATLHVESDPPGGEVIVEGKPRGKTPVDVTLDAFHHYDVQVMLLGTKPWHKRISLKPPQTNVTANLSVVHNP